MTSELLYTREEIEKNNAVREFNNREFNRLKSDLKNVMATPHGRRVVDWIIRISNLHHDHFTKDSHQTAYNIGRSYPGQQLFNLIMIECHDLYLKMVHEYRSRITSDRKDLKND